MLKLDLFKQDQNKPHSRNFGLDLIRMVAIIIVILYHWIGGNLMKIFPNDIQYFSLLGYLGVEFFFVLSGFLIGNIIIRSYTNGTIYNLNTVKNFWFRRWFRTLPLYFSIFIVYLLIAIYKDQMSADLWKYLFFLQNFFKYNTENHNFFGVSWSLAIEEWFYILFPIFLILSNWIFRKYLHKLYIISFVILLFILSGPLIRHLYIVNSDNGISWNDVLRKAVVCREDSIAFGVLCALIYNFKVDFFKRYKSINFIIGLILISICSFVFLKEVAGNYYYGRGYLSYFSQNFLFSLVSLSVALMLPWFFFLKVNNVLLKGIVTHISKISYSLYLTHLFVFQLIHKLLPGEFNYYIIILSLFCFIALSILVSTLTYIYIEEKFLEVRDKMTTKELKPV